MCGILGQVSTGAPIDPAVFESMLETLEARGPDGSGVRHLAGGRVALGHRRLAIVDLSAAGAQPMANEDETVWLVANGEIYDHRELAKELTAAGHRFRSESDSEVILHAYEEWGDDCVHRLGGVFAFAIFDLRRDRLFLARDPLGVKPLYLWRRPEGVVFASQPRAILAHPEFRADVDRAALQSYLALRYVPGDQAIYAGMSKLPAGHRLVAERGDVRVERYWRAEYRPTVRDADDAVHLVRDVVARAVRSQRVADVPVGVFLSGGIDSSAVAAAAAAAGAPPPCFTLGFEDAESDERSWARITAAALRCPHHETLLSDRDILAALPKFASLYDEPFFDDSGLATHAVAHAARERGVKVILSGDGGDEVFAGYRWYDEFFADPSRQWRRRLASLLRGRSPGSPEATYFRLQGYLDAEAQTALLGPIGDFDPLARFRRLFRRDIPEITALQLLDLESFLVDDVLTKVDHASMACGVEVRVPLLDLHVVEAAFSIDHRIVYAEGERKSLFKRAVGEWLPPEVVSGRKKGFSVQIVKRMGTDAHRTAGRLLDDGALVGRGIFRPDGVRTLLDRADPGTTWLLLAAELWARRWLEGDDTVAISGEPS